MKKRIIALLLALVMVVGMLPTVALAADAPIQDEDGYYQLTNEADLKWFRDKVNAGEGTINARLMADVTLTESWTPIGVAADYVTSYDNKPFSGIFDGNEKTISGLNVTETAGNPAALFGMAKNATIKKLVVKGTVSSTAPSGGYMPVYAGGVVGQSDGGVTLEEVASYVDVTMTNSTSNTGAIGGLAGNGYGITIKNCANYGKLTAEGSAEAHIGGLSAISPWGGKAAIENSVNVGEIVGGSTVGGLITKANDGTTVKNSATVGEPAGTLGGTFENCLGNREHGWRRRRRDRCRHEGCEGSHDPRQRFQEGREIRFSHPDMDDRYRSGRTGMQARAYRTQIREQERRHAHRHDNLQGLRPDDW